MAELIFLMNYKNFKYIKGGRLNANNWCMEIFSIFSFIRNVAKWLNYDQTNVETIKLMNNFFKLTNYKKVEA